MVSYWQKCWIFILQICNHSHLKKLIPRCIAHSVNWYFSLGNGGDVVDAAAQDLARHLSPPVSENRMTAAPSPTNCTTSKDTPNLATNLLFSTRPLLLTTFLSPAPSWDLTLTV